MSKKYSFETFMEWYETQTFDGNFFGLVKKYFKELEANTDPTANNDSALDVEDQNTVTIDLLANDTDADGDFISVVWVGDAPNGTVTDNGDGTVTYVPAPDFNGTDTFSYTISDGKGGESTATVTILVEAVNDAPVVLDVSYGGVEEDGAAQVFAYGASDVDGDKLSYQILTQPVEGTVSDNGDGTFTFNPGAGFQDLGEGETRQVSFVYAASDGNGGSGQATATVTVTGTNDAPVVSAHTAFDQEDKNTVTIDLLADAGDLDGDTLTVIYIEDASNGKVTDNGDGTVTYVPYPDFNGTDTFSYTVSDGNGGESTGTVSVFVAPVNDVPVANDDQAQTLQDTSVIVDLLANDSDIDGDTLSIGAIGAAQNGTVAENNDGTVTYTPNNGFSGTDSFTYTVVDGNGGSATATATVTVDANAPLDIEPAAPPPLVTTEIVVNAWGSSADGVAPHMIVMVDGDIVGDVNVTATSETQYVFSADLIPGQGHKVQVRFDNDALINGQDRNLYVSSIEVNDQVVASDDPMVTYDRRALDGQDVIAGSTVMPWEGTLVYDLSADYFTVESTTGGGNTAPVANDDFGQTDDVTPIKLNLLANDTDADADSLKIISLGAAQNGTVADNGDGTVTYTPNVGFSGTDNFLYTVSDGNGGESTAVVKVDVEKSAVVDPSVVNTEIIVNASGQSAGGVAPLMIVSIDGVEIGRTYVTSTTETSFVYDADLVTGQGHDVQVRYDNDAVVDGGDRNLFVASIVVNGQTVASTDTNVTYDKGALDGANVISGQTVMAWTGTLVFSLPATSFPPPIDPDNTAPVAQEVFVGGVTEDGGWKAFAYQATDADGDALSYQVVNQPSEGSVSDNGNGTFTFNPGSDFQDLGSGETRDVSFTYRVNDDRGGSDTASATVTITGANDGPSANDDAASTGANKSTNINVLSNDKDVDGDTLSVTSVGSASNGWVTLNADGTVTYTPDLDFSGADSFDYAIADGNGGVDTATVNVEVTQSAAQPSGPAFYVSPFGNDSWSGTLTEPNADGTDGPFATLQQARDAMRSDSNVDTTYVREGTYYLKSALALDSNDSGVTFAAYPGESPVISGGEKVTGFVHEGNGIYSAKLGIASGLDLSIGGVRQFAAQMVDSDANNPYTSGWSTASSASGGASRTQFKFQPGEVQASDIKPGMLVEVFAPERWTNNILEIQSVDFNTNTITLKGNATYSLSDGSTFRLLNNPDHVTADGEFAWRTSDGRLVLNPENPATFEQDGVVVARLNNLFNLNNADNVSIVGLTFSDVVKSGDALYLNGVDNSLFTHNTFMNVGTAIDMRGSHYNAIAGNELGQIASTGINMKASDNNMVNSNYIHHVGQLNKGGGAIQASDVEFNTISNNTIEYAARYGISIKDGGTVKNFGNVIEYNKILHTSLETSDTGAIEMLGRSDADTQTIIRYNYIEDTGGVGTDSNGAFTRLDWSSGVYLDDKTSGVDIVGNFIKDAGWGSVYVHGGDDVLIENNIAVLDDDRDYWWGPDSMEEFIILNRIGTNIMENINIVRNVIYAETPIEDHWWYMNGDQPNIDFNLLFNTTRFSDSGVTGDANSIFADPLFVDALAGNYSLTSGSPAFSLGIQDLPWDQMGLSTDRPINVLGIALPEGYDVYFTY